MMCGTLLPELPPRRSLRMVRVMSRCVVEETLTVVLWIVVASSVPADRPPGHAAPLQSQSLSERTLRLRLYYWDAFDASAPTHVIHGSGRSSARVITAARAVWGYGSVNPDNFTALDALCIHRSVLVFPVRMSVLSRLVTICMAST